MTDAFSLAALGGVAITEGIKFLYGQVAEVIKAWRARREGSPESIEVPLITTQALDAHVAMAVVNTEVIAVHEAAMVDLWSSLAPYAAGLKEVAPGDSILVKAGELRTLLEAAYGCRLTFLGEHRDGTGTPIEVTQTLDSVAGEVVGVQGHIARTAALSVRQEVREVAETGAIFGIRGTVGS